MSIVNEMLRRLLAGDLPGERPGEAGPACMTPESMNTMPDMLRRIGDLPGAGISGSAEGEGQHRRIIQYRHNEEGAEPIVGRFDGVDYGAYQFAQ
jgi:hypothetical protein